MDIAPLFVSLGLFAMIFGIVYLTVTTRNRERMALIEKGVDPTLFDTAFNKQRMALIEKVTDPSLYASVNRGKSNRIIKWGVFLFGVGLGIVVANILVKNEVMDEDSAYFAMIFIFGGLALIATYLFLRKQEKHDEVKI